MTPEQLITWLEMRLAEARARQEASPVGSVARMEAGEKIRRLEADLIEVRSGLALSDASDRQPVAVGAGTSSGPWPAAGDRGRPGSGQSG